MHKKNSGISLQRSLLSIKSQAFGQNLIKNEDPCRQFPGIIYEFQEFLPLKPTPYSCFIEKHNAVASV